MYEPLVPGEISAVTSTPKANTPPPAAPTHLRTGPAASGPTANATGVAEALIEAAVAEGLPRPVAERLVVGTVRGAGMMLAESGQSAGELRAGVTSPGGTTAAGLRALEDRAVRGAFAAAVAAATERSRLLGAG